MNELPIHYKFMMKEHVGDFLRGRVRMADLSYFRQLEGPDWIADRGEGIGETYVHDSLEGLSERDREIQRRRINMTRVINIADGVEGAHLKNMLLTVAPRKVYVLCFAIGPFVSVEAAMCKDAPEGWKYDACVEISDARALAQAIIDTGTVDGVPLGPEINPKDSLLDTVKYGDREVDLRYGSPVDPVFTKPRKFFAQQEARLALYRYSDSLITDDVIFVDFNVPKGVLREIVIK